MYTDQAKKATVVEVFSANDLNQNLLASPRVDLLFAATLIRKPGCLLGRRQISPSRQLQVVSASLS